LQIGTPQNLQIVGMLLEAGGVLLAS